MKKVFICIGTRPQIIKASNFLKEFNKFELDIHLINSSQHYDKKMFKDFITEFELNHFRFNSFEINKKKIFISDFYNYLIKQIKIKKPEYLINFGDTNTTLVSSIAAKKSNIKLIHIESGLRSNNLSQQEEINRKIADTISDLRICPTLSSLKNLRKEGLGNNSYFMGDLMFELFEQTHKKIKKNQINNSFIYMTLHRAENVDDKIKVIEICKFINTLNSKNYIIYLPLHHRLKKYKSILTKYINNLKIIGPLKYIDSLNLIYNSSFIITDSGGLQKESHFLKKKCYVLRNESEWKEAIDQGYTKLLEQEKFKTKKYKPYVYGKGKIASKISKKIYQFILEDKNKPDN